MALPDKNITTKMVREELKEETQQLSSLCTSKNINKWSNWKPIDTTDTTLTDATIQYNNGGFSNLNAMYCNTLLQCQNICDNGGNVWNYQKPTKFRLGDFRNYNHTHPNWMELVGTQVDDNRLIFTFKGNNLHNISKYKDVQEMGMNGYGLMFFYRNSGNDTKYYHLGDIAQYSGTTMMVTTSGLTDATNYKILPILSHTPNAQRNKWYSVEQCTQNGFRFLATDGTPYNFTYESADGKQFNNLQLTLYISALSFTGNVAKISCAYDICNKNNQNVQLHITIQHNAENKAQRVLFEDNIVLNGDGIFSFPLSSSFATYDATTTPELRLTIQLGTTTKDVVFNWDKNATITNQQTYKANKETQWTWQQQY